MVELMLLDNDEVSPCECSEFKLISDGADLIVHWVSEKCLYKRFVSQLHEQFVAVVPIGDPRPIPYHEFADDDKLALFMVAEGAEVIGGGSFYQRWPADGGPVWSFQWLWTLPKARGRRLYESLHPILKERFSRFYPEPPLSSTMEKILKAIDPELLTYSEIGLLLGECVLCNSEVFLMQDSEPIMVNNQLRYRHLGRCQE